MRILKDAIPLLCLLASIGVQAQTVLATLNYPAGVNGVAVDYVRNRAYVLLPEYTALGGNALQVLNGRTNSLIATYPVPVANALAVNQLTGLLYLGGVEPSSTSSTGIQAVVVVVDPRDGNVITTIPITTNFGSGIVALAADPKSNRVFVSDDTDNAIVVIDGRTNQVTASVSLDGQSPASLGVNFFTGKVYAALGDNQVAILHQWDNSVEYVTYGSNTQGIAVDPLINREYVTDAVFENPTVGVLNFKGDTLAAIPIGSYALSADVDFVRSRVFVASEADGTITEINALRNEVITTLPVAANSVVVNPTEATVYAVGPTSVEVFRE